VLRDGHETGNANERKGSVEMSFFPRSLLLATDGSAEANLATEAAIELSRETGSQMHVGYVLPTPAQLIGYHLYSDEIKETLIGGAEREAEKFLKEQAERIGSGGGKVAETHLRSGDPKKEVLRLAEALEVGMIVIGSRGLGAVSRALMGSVSDSVVRHAHCPVFVVRG
jgi:nucleotide-binding universal stress UspA family protein